ncbi:hypothetical protein ACS3UN_05480 [Oscillospiraceae bacterium LTW-04]|nr:hypothetical protein RBH76_04885 [Oscillospiraceae bacterium MB24-C1]
MTRDDGINAAGSDSSGDSFGKPGTANSNCNVTITGVTITVNAAGDGLDSNGILTIEGGFVIVNGSTSNGNSALDYDNSSTITGGTLIAIGSSGMAQAPGSDSTQPVLSITFSEMQKDDTVVNLTDKAGNLILSFVLKSAFRISSSVRHFLKPAKPIRFTQEP